ncbi:hypothetical protein HYDPIDRAFT_57198, partial [Hydnomerulius pinastri MD-312]
YVVAWVCIGIGTVNMIWLWYGWNKNYVGIVYHLVISGLLVSLATMLSALANVYGAGGGIHSRTSKSMFIVTMVVALLFAVLFIACRGIFLLKRLKKNDDQAVGKQLAG